MNYLAESENIRFIEAPHNFSSTIMDSVRAGEERRATIFAIIFVISAFAPAIMRLFWNLIRHDYFSLATLPMGTTLTKIYTTSMSGVVFFILISLAIIAISWRFRLAGVLLHGKVYGILNAWQKGQHQT